MMTTDLTLDKKAHPLMMHLSIVPKIEISDDEEEFKYDPKTQTSNITAMSGSWCTVNGSTGDGVFKPGDEDQKEDD